MSTLKVDNVTNTAGNTTVNSIEIEDSGWIFVGDTGAPAFENSWVDYGSTFGSPRFRKINGIVHMEGLIKDGTVGSTAFTLPAGYRPYNRLIIASQASNALGRLDVLEDGSVAPWAGSNSWFSITCSFVAHQ